MRGGPILIYGVGEQGINSHGGFRGKNVAQKSCTGSHFVVPGTIHVVHTHEKSTNGLIIRQPLAVC